MQLHTDKQPGSRLDLTFSLDTADVRRAFDKVYGEIAQGGAIPGFRPGKAPASLIKRRFKPEILRDMFWMKAVETFVEPELQKDELHVIGDPEFPNFEEIEVAEDAPVEFTIKVTVEPTPELPEYKGLKLYRMDATVSDERVAEVLQQMRETAGKEVAVEGRDTVEQGDLVEAELKIVLEGQEEPVNVSSQTFEIGSGRYTPAIDEALVGHKLDETVEIAHEYPEDHDDEELAGQKATIYATIEEIRQRILPELDDEFAKSQGEYESLEDLQTKLRAQLKEEAARRSRETLENDALAAVVEDTKVDLPQNLVEGLARRGYAEFVQELQENGMSVEEFLQIAGANQETLQVNEYIRAQMALKVQFTLKALVDAEGIEVTEEALAEEVKRFAEGAHLEPDFVERALDVQEGFREQLEDRVLRRLVIQRLIENAEIEDVSPERYAEIKEEEREAARLKAEEEAKQAEAAAAEAEATAAEAEKAPAAEADAETEAPAADTEAVAETEEAAVEAAAETAEESEAATEESKEQ